jgi:hypothetical protein
MALKKHQNAKTLHVCCNKMNTRALKHLSSAPLLEYLSLYRPNYITDAALKHVSQLSSLVCLELHSTERITSQGVNLAISLGIFQISSYDN